jgi:hypothetical protein
LVTGVPGAGKTLVGLQAVHAKYLDDLAVEREGEKPTVPAVFLSGNGPLVEVLQYELRDAGGGGKAFVRGVKDYVKRYLKNEKLTPPEHVIVFDEAQRAYDKEMVAAKHPDLPAKSEPELMVNFADRIPEWSVLVGLIGSGQEIHLGEEAGMSQWLKALQASKNPGAWTVHYPPSLSAVFAGAELANEERAELNLTVELRFHLADQLHDFVAGLLDSRPAHELSRIAQALGQQGYHLRITRDLDIAKTYLRDRYKENSDARFGIVASRATRRSASSGFQTASRIRRMSDLALGTASPRATSTEGAVATSLSASRSSGLRGWSLMLRWWVGAQIFFWHRASGQMRTLVRTKTRRPCAIRFSCARMRTECS